MVSPDLVLPSMAMLPVAAGATSPVGGASRREGRPATASPSLAPRRHRCLEDVAVVPHARLVSAALVVLASCAGSTRPTRGRHARERAAAGSVHHHVSSIGLGPAASLSADPPVGHILLVIYQRSSLLKDERLGWVSGLWTKMRLPLFPITPLSAMLLFTFSQMHVVGGHLVLAQTLIVAAAHFPVQVRNHVCFSCSVGNSDLKVTVCVCAWLRLHFISDYLFGALVHWQKFKWLQKLSNNPRGRHIFVGILPYELLVGKNWFASFIHYLRHGEYGRQANISASHFV